MNLDEMIKFFGTYDRSNMGEEETTRLLDGLQMLKRRYAVYGFNDQCEEWCRRNADEPDVTCETLGEAVKLASQLLREWDYVTVMDRMSDKQVFTTESLNAELPIVQPYTSLWEMLNCGVITDKEYRILKNKPWDVVSEIVNSPNAKERLNTYFRSL